MDNRQSQAGDAREPLVVCLRDRQSARQQFILVYHLSTTDRRLQIGHAVVEADDGMIVAALLGHAVVAQRGGLFRPLLVIGDDHAPLTGRNDLVGIEAEAADIR